MTREQALALKQAAPLWTLLARALGVRNDERAWRIGADGEEKVAAQLEKVIVKDPPWRILHAVRVGERGSDIDHIVIGPWRRVHDQCQAPSGRQGLGRW
jgi:hypothetical protein